MFSLDPRLETSSSFVCDLDLCQIRLSHNAAFPWILLIPRRENLFELTDLSDNEQHSLMQEIILASQVMRDCFQPDKLNIATLGNVVPQMHIHVIARYKKDPAWPNPVWNSGIDSSYEQREYLALIQKINISFSIKYVKN
jgi:diadenosine tetraphosphate (Ap4A) HIT family hydrolase